ncbi:MAG TPA: hypothetical protein VEK11_13415 [Thermoanaerobaculia bacterium]|jgi:hypothetical protein|nr:hypothetical protein [Thermoanaerobaculia bacterium]
MDANEPHYIVCQNGVFTLPESLLRALSSQTRRFVYLRQDEDSLTISTTRIADGHRRVLNARMRAPMFREATCLAIVDLRESLRVMPVEWRVNATGRAPREPLPAAE